MHDAPPLPATLRPLLTLVEEQRLTVDLQKMTVYISVQRANDRLSLKSVFEATIFFLVVL